MKRYLISLILLLSLLTGITKSQSGLNIPGTITSTGSCPGTSCVSTSTLGYSSVGVEITGPWVGTLNFEATIDGSTWSSLGLSSTTASTSPFTSSTKNNGKFISSIGSFSAFRVRASAFTSGTATITIAVSTGISSQSPVVIQGIGGSAASVRPDNYFRVALEPSPLFSDVFDSTLDTTDRWNLFGTVPTSSVGALTISPGTTALAFSGMTSKPAFQLLGTMYNYAHTVLKMDSGLKTGAYRFYGFATVPGSPTVAAPITDGVVFEWSDIDGILYGVAWAGGVRAQFTSLAASQPTDGAFHRYGIYYKSSRAYFEIDNVSVGTISNPAPNTSNLPLSAFNINGAGTVSPAAVYQPTAMGVSDTSHNNQYISDPNFAWRKASVRPAANAAVLSTDNALLVSVVGIDPCSSSGFAKSSVPINISSATTTQLVALSGTTKVYVCGFDVTILGLITTAGSIQFEYGTGASCGTGTTTLTGTMQGQAVAGQTLLVVPPGGGTQFSTASGTALCVVTTGTAPQFQGFLTYVQQ